MKATLQGDTRAKTGAETRSRQHRITFSEEILALKHHFSATC